MLCTKFPIIAAFYCIYLMCVQITSDGGLTILQKSVIEHNMIATGKIYDNIRIEQLTSILRLADIYHTEKVGWFISCV